MPANVVLEKFIQEYANGAFELKISYSNNGK